MSNHWYAVHLSLSPQTNFEARVGFCGSASAVIARGPYRGWSDFRRTNLVTEGNRIKPRSVRLGTLLEKPIDGPGGGSALSVIGRPHAPKA